VTERGGDSAGTDIAVPGGSGIRLSWAAVTDVGRKRKANEDSYLARVPIFAVADGMGGHLSGDLASAAVVRRLDEGITTDFVAPQLVERSLEVASSDIDVIAGDSELGVGTTVTGAILTLIDGIPNFAVFNIADSAISVGVVMLAALLWLGGAEERTGGAPTTPTDGSSGEAQAVSAKNSSES